jgi:proteasome lid subunit RPN8/RPN11
MVKCGTYSGVPGSGAPGSQPFAVTVGSNALVLMDLHAHLKPIEIIGFLSGHWDASAKHIRIEAAWPCRSVATADDHTNVEMDPTSEFEVRALIKAQGQEIVGWYHSHPTFPPDLSLVDIQNQANYQHLFEKDGCKEAPFVGAIVGNVSVISFFALFLKFIISKAHTTRFYQAPCLSLTGSMSETQ